MEVALSVAKILSVAAGEVGTHETFAGGHWVNNSRYNQWFGKIPGYGQDGYGWPWCAAYVSWVAHESGHADLFPHTASCAVAVSWFKTRGRFSEYPAVGAQVFFGSGGGAHTGLVYAYDADYIYTYEGNTNTNGSAEGDGVYAKRRARRDAYVYGYGYPDVPGGSVSADPEAAKFGYEHSATGSAPKAKAEPKAKPAAKDAPATKAKPKPKVSVKRLNAARAKDMPAATGHKTYPDDVMVVERALFAEGLLPSHVDGSWGTLTQDAYDNFRRKAGYKGSDATGAVGLASLRKLAARHGFTAVA